jgi:hypothetical protein
VKSEKSHEKSRNAIFVDLISIISKHAWAWRHGSIDKEYLPGKQKALNSNPSTKKICIKTYAC